MAILQLQKCLMAFGGLKAVSDLSIEIEPTDLVGMIGPNGAGKTTVFNLITGVYRPTAGRIIFNQHEITGQKPYQIAKHGIARTFQNIRLFPSLTVYENVQVSQVMWLTHGLWDAVVHLKRYYDEEKTVQRAIMELLEIFNLLPYKDEPATSLPYGDQRRVEIVRALATRPKLLLLDEPAAGMNPTEKRDLMELIKAVKDRYKIAILLIEHDMNVVMGICERIFVLDYGLMIAEGSPAVIRRDPKVIEAYLGEVDE